MDNSLCDWLDEFNVTVLPAVQVLVLVIEGEAGHLTLEVSKLWLRCHISTEQEPA